MKSSASRSIAMLLASSACVLAQDEQPQPPQPAVPAPAAPRAPLIPPLTPLTPAQQAAKPNVANAANPQDLPLADRPISQPVSYPKMNGADLAKLYQEYTGRRVLVTAAANQAEFAFEQSPPLTFGEAAQLLRKAATLEGFVFVPDADDENLDILTTTNGGLNPKGRGLEIFTENDPLPDGDRVISYVMPLKHLKPETAAQIFNQVVGQVGAYGSITPVPNAAGIVITENTSLIRRLIQLKEQVDKPSSHVDRRFIKVQYADVTELAQTLNDLLNSQQQSQRTAGVQRTDAAPNPAANRGAEATSAGEDSPVQIFPDARTNRIFAMGRPVDLLFVETLVNEFDVQSDNKNFLRRKLRFLSVRDFLPIAGDALTRAFTGTGTGGGGAGQGPSGANFGGQGGGRGAQANTNRGSTGAGARGQSSSPFGGSSSGIGGGGGLGGSGAGSSTGGNRGNTLQAPDVSTAPESILVGRTLLVADNITNSIVVQGTPASVEIIEKLLDEVDVKADQVMISCVFGQLALGKSHSFGVDYAKALGNSKFAGRGGSGESPIGTGTGPIIPPATSAPTTPGLPLNPGWMFSPGSLGPAAGLGLYGKIGNNLHVFLNALQSKSDFKVLARPTIFTSNNQKGTITSGTKIAIPTNTVQYTGTSSPSTSFEYQDVDLSLEVVPLINSKEEITLKIYLVSNDIGQNRSVGALGEGQLEIPDIIKRELLTTVTVPNNETIVLGGLITTRDNKTKSGIPILSQIPLIGGLFGKESITKDRDELLIFIQPSIVYNNQTLDAVQEDADRRFKISPSARNFSEGPGVLPVKDSSIMPIDDKGKDSGAVAPSATPTKRRTPSVKR